MKPLDRGLVVYVDLDPARGHEQAGQRPALVVSNDKLKPERSELITILPITTRERALRTRIALRPPEGGVRKPSWVIGEQIRTISIERVSSVWGSVMDSTMADVDRILQFLLKLRGG